MDIGDPAHAASPADIRRLGLQGSTCFDDGGAVAPEIISRPELRQFGEELARVVSPGPVHDTGTNQPEPEVQRVPEYIDQYDPWNQLRNFQNRVQIPPRWHSPTRSLAFPIHKGVLQKMFHHHSLVF